MYYTPNMTVISETEIDPQTAKHIESILLPATGPISETPTVYAMAGIPGAGKSEFVKGAIERGEFPRDAFILDPDRVMQALPTYQDDLALSGKQTAFRKWEIPARLLAYHLADQATTRKIDIIQDMGGVRREDYNRLMQYKNRGYRIEMTYIYCGVDECLRRVGKRTTRHTAEEMVRERNESLRLLLPEYVKMVDAFRVFDNSDMAHPFKPTTLEKLT
jgi:predicted ABC-type ATPase